MHDLAVGFGAAKQEIPIRGVVLHDLLESRRCRFDVLRSE